MTLDEIFFPLVYGFSDFERVKDRLSDCRAKNRIPENAKTVISVLFPYYLGEEYYKNSNISRYAVSEDYHIITKKYAEKIIERLYSEFPGNRFEFFSDNSPLPEVECAVNAGLGVRGKNSLFINKIYGSWVFLGEIVTDRYFLPSEKEQTECDSCGECIRRCPMNAIKPNGVEKEKCLSFLTQKKSGLTPDVAKKMSEFNCAWGCDICQKVCPMNINAKTTPVPEFFDTAKPLVSENDSVEGRAYEWRGKDVIKRNIKMMQDFK